MINRNFLIYFLIASGLFSTATFARIGEPVTIIKSRIKMKARGEAYESKVFQAKAAKAPYKKLNQILFSDEYNGKIQLSIFWKPSKEGQVFRAKAKGGKSSLPNYGWDLHVISIQGKAVCELYHKLDGNIDEVERNAILTRNTTGDSWSKTDAANKGKSLFPYDFKLKKGSLCAKMTSQDLFIYESKIQPVVDLIINEINEERKRDRNQASEDSVFGF